MSDTHGSEGLTPQENTFFESKGETTPELAPASETTTQEQPLGEQPAGTTPEQPRHVPLNALHEEREVRKEIERRLRETEQEHARAREENIRFRERFDILARSAAGSEKPPPKPEEDLFGAVDHTDRRVSQLEQILREQSQQQQHNAARTQIVNTYAADAQRFAGATPDFTDAYSFLLKSRDAELQAMGYHDAAERMQARQNDELNVAATALQRGLSPAEVIYNLAKARGYSKKAGAGNGAADRLANVAAGQEANRSLSSVGGSAGAEEMTAERLLKMPLDEFEKWTNKNPKQARRIMGG